MQNISFIGREAELERIRQLQNKSFLLVVKGRRRIGKTTLLRTAFPRARYLFIWPNKSIHWIIERICTEQQLPQFRTFSDLLTYLLDQRIVVILDEFQNFLSVDSSIYGEIQKIVDERKQNKKFLKLAVAGSSYSLVNKVFNDAAAPLYGRRDAEIALDHLPLPALYRELGLSLSEFIELWAVLEGVPYYYEFLDTRLSARENIARLILLKEATLGDEGKAILSVEFGRDSKTYNTVLSAIAEGKTKLQEIASLFDGKTNEVIKYLDLLRREFRFVQRQTPILADPRKSKEGQYQIIDNFLQFWFYFVDKQRDYLEQERHAEVLEFFTTNFNSFVGQKFEKFVLTMLGATLLQRYGMKKIGRQWGSIPQAEKGQNQYEIDLCALNEKTNEILFGECKWQENVDAFQELRELQHKAAFVPWRNQNRKEHYALFAKSFKDKNIKEAALFDLKDMEKVLRT